MSSKGLSELAAPKTNNSEDSPFKCARFNRSRTHSEGQLARIVNSQNVETFSEGCRRATAKARRARNKPVATPCHCMVDLVATEKTMAWIVADVDHLGGKPRVRDTRISVALLLEWLAAGMTIGEIAKEYPSLTEESIRGVLEELAHSDLLAPSENPSRREHA